MPRLQRLPLGRALRPVRRERRPPRLRRVRRRRPGPDLAPLVHGRRRALGAALDPVPLRLAGRARPDGAARRHARCATASPAGGASRSPRRARSTSPSGKRPSATGMSATSSRASRSRAAGAPSCSSGSQPSSRSLELGAARLDEPLVGRAAGRRELERRRRSTRPRAAQLGERAVELVELERRGRPRARPRRSAHARRTRPSSPALLGLDLDSRRGRRAARRSAAGPRGARARRARARARAAESSSCGAAKPSPTPSAAPSRSSAAAPRAAAR